MWFSHKLKLKLWPDLGKPTIYTHRLNFILLHQWITTLKDCSCTASPLATVNWSAFLNVNLPTLCRHGCENGAMGRHLLGGQHLKLLILLDRRLFGIVVWQRLLLVTCTGSKGYYWWCFLLPPHPPAPPRPPTRPPPYTTVLKLLPTLKKSSQNA